jgi:hypothetical protein
VKERGREGEERASETISKQLISLSLSLSLSLFLSLSLSLSLSHSECSLTEKTMKGSPHLKWK